MATTWAYKEGIFELKNGDFIVRIKGKDGHHRTMSRHRAKEEAEDAYNKLIRAT